MTIGDTDVVPGTEEEDEPRYGFWATLVGQPLLERRLLAGVKRLLTANAADIAALQEALTEARSADRSVDDIAPMPLNHQPKSKKGTKP